MSSKVNIVLKTGLIGATERQKKTVLGLGLKYRQATKSLKDTPAIRGMIAKVVHLVKVVKENEKEHPFSAISEYELGAVSEVGVKRKKSLQKPKSKISTENLTEPKKITNSSKKEKTITVKKQKAKVITSHKVSAKKDSKKVKKS